MKILWYSTALFVGVGYGVIARNLVHRLQADGHEVKIATKHHIGGQLITEGIETFDGTELSLVSKIINEEGYDYIVSVMDMWPLPKSAFPKDKWVAVNFLDLEFIFPTMIDRLKEAQYQVAVTEHGKKEMERAGFNPFYAPLGVDTKLFKPDADLGKACRAKKGWGDDKFVVGVVGINYGTDRKNLVGTIRAFQGFHKKHPDSILYLHTDIMGSVSGGLPLQWILNSCGFEATNTGPVYFADQKQYHLWAIAQEEVARLYNSFDVLCLPSHGEGFGMPWLEAQSCGVPIISVDTTSAKQLNFSGWLIPAQEDYFRYSTLNSWFVDAPPSAIEHQLELAYTEWKNGKINKRKIKARKEALKYDWDTVYAKYWRPMFDSLSSKNMVIRKLPNYGTEFYEKFGGQVLMTDCWSVCKNTECKKCTSENHHLLQGEWKGPAPILQRSYPIVPDVNGNLLISTKCDIYKWVSPRFINECKQNWAQLFSYPVIRQEIAKLWAEGYFSDEFITLEEAASSRKFDDNYALAMQSNYHTTFQFLPEMTDQLKAGDKTLDVGTGDGERVRFLQSKGFDAIGTEINSKWINEKDIVYGDSLALPFKDNEFRMVSSIDVLEHIADPVKALKELFRVSNEYVIVQITSNNDKTYLEDASHIVNWSEDRWIREISEFGDFVKSFSGCTFMIKKKK